ncbi:MAG: amino acid ABC transporter permease, partial [Planctomycetota bacterium]
MERVKARMAVASVRRRGTGNPEPACGSALPSVRRDGMGNPEPASPTTHLAAWYALRMPRWLAHVIVVVAFAAAVVAAFARVDYEWNWAAVWDYRQKFLQGWLVTVGLSLAALVTSIVIGGVTAVMLRSGNALLEAAARVYVELIRGTPLLVQLLIGFYVVATAVGLENRYVAGVLLLSMFSGAYMAEIFRGGLAAIPQTQRDAARAIGLTPWQALRLVILPQAVRLVLPAVAGQFV